MSESNSLHSLPDLAAVTLLALREDLKLETAPRGQDGTPHWHLIDPVRNRFFRIGWLEFEMLSRWRAGMAAATLCEQVARETVLAPEPDDVTGLQYFLQANELLRADAARLRAELQRIALRRTLSRWQWLLHHYLFFRIPLVKPEAFLARTGRYFAPLFRPSLFFWLGLLCTAALWRVLDQWATFSQTFLYFFSWEGALYYALALALTKILHELAHAYTCRHFGVRVPTMGVAMMLLWPLLYTDTSEAWKLKSRRARLAIGGAGVVAELMLAALAALVWSVAPDGALKSAAYILAAVTWISTLAINLNPFMRFDGYYLLMDALDIPNLSERSFAIGRWQLRRSLLGVEDPMPDPQLESRRRWLSFYAYLTWVYRMVLFAGIAAAVYFFFFKLAGVILFVVEIVWFVLRPLWNELGAWWQIRASWRPRAAVSACVLLLALSALALPWRSEVVAEGYWQAGQYSRLYPPMPSRLSRILVADGQAVRAGEPLFILSDPQIENQWQQLQSRIAGLQSQLAGSIGNVELREMAPVLEQQLAAAIAAQALQNQERARLTVRAPHAGIVRDLDRGIFPGSWLGPRHVLGRVIGGADSQAHLFVHESDIGRIEVGATVRLMMRRPDTVGIDAIVTGIDNSASRVLPEAMLASVYGGPIAARSTPRGELLAHEALYRVTLRVAQADVQQLTPVVGHIDAGHSSMLWNFMRQAMAIVIRESGF
ncbi:MAG TPA: HlyD family efflux transporter periplasmic adaptor subunit [Pseudomonas sp.]|nr:HlyD family efflux transporter periplasmic adaptor subunit [Pseudomonas sp.]